MNESEIHNTLGIDGLIEFGRYLTTLADSPYNQYSFAMPDGTGNVKECSLEDVLTRFQEFRDRKTDTFCVSIGYNDYQHGTMGRCDRTFTRRL